MSKIIKLLVSKPEPKKGSVLLRAVADPTNIMNSVYLNRVALMAAVPDGHIPTKVEISVKVLETAPEAASAE